MDVMVFGKNFNVSKPLLKHAQQRALDLFSKFRMKDGDSLRISLKRENRDNIVMAQMLGCSKNCTVKLKHDSMYQGISVAVSALQKQYIKEKKKRLSR